MDFVSTQRLSHHCDDDVQRSRHGIRRRGDSVTGAADPKQADLVFLGDLIDAGQLRTVIGRRYRLDEIADAHRYADTGHKIGNVAVLIGDPDTAVQTT